MNEDFEAARNAQAQRDTARAQGKEPPRSEEETAELKERLRRLTDEHPFETEES